MKRTSICMVFVFLISIIHINAAVSIPTNPDIWLEADCGIEYSDGLVSKWSDIRNNSVYFSQSDVDKMPKKAEESVEFNFNDSMKIAADTKYTGENTVFIVVKSKENNGTGNFAINTLSCDSTAIVSQNILQDNKNIGMLESEDYFILSYKQYIYNNKAVVKSWIDIDGGSTRTVYASNVGINEFNYINQLGGGNSFDVKAVLAYKRGLNDTEISSVSQYLKGKYIIGSAFCAQNINYYYDGQELSVNLQMRSNQKDKQQPCIIVGTIIDEKGKTVAMSVSEKKILGASSYSDFSLSNIKGNNGVRFVLYAWDGLSEIVPLTGKFGVLISDINRIPPMTTEPPESEKVIPDFVPSLPSVSEMKLKLNQFDNENMNYIAAKGFLEKDSIYDEDAVISADLFSQLTFRIIGGGIVYGGDLMRKDALKILYDALKTQFKTYRVLAFDMPYTDINALDAQYKTAIQSCYLSGIISPSTLLNPYEYITQGEAFALLKNAIINTEMVEHDAGTQIPYVSYHAKYARTNAEKMISTQFADNIAFEAIGGECVILKNQNDFISFENAPSSNRLVLRYSVPKPNKQFDSQGYALPVDDVSTVNLYVNGLKRQTITLHSLDIYTEKDNSTAVSYEYYFKKLFTDVIIETEIKQGDLVEFKFDSENHMPQKDAIGKGISINLLNFETAPEPLSQPQNFISVLQYGAAPDDDIDDTLAFKKTISAAYVSGMGVYIPKGNYKIGEKLIIPSGVNVMGAGMWHTTLENYVENKYTRGGRSGFIIRGDNIEISNLKITSSTNVRRHSSAGSGFSEGGRNINIHDVWVDRTGTGIWMRSYDTVVRSCRFTNCFADGIHFLNPSQGILIENCFVIGGGDDGIATTGEINSNGYNVTDIKIRNNTILGTYWGRGIMLSGTNRATVENNYIGYSYRAPGILIWSEGTYDTFSTYDVIVKENIVMKCGRVSGLNRGAITIFNNHKGYFIDADVYDNEVYKSRDANGYYIVDYADKVYCEMKNNISNMAENSAYKPFETYIINPNSKVIMNDNVKF